MSQSPPRGAGGFEREGAVWDRRDSRAAAACALLGLLLAVAPHLATLARRGTLEYLTDTNDVAYLTIGRGPYYGDASMSDAYTRPEWGIGAAADGPVQLPGGKLPSRYAWLQFVPLARLTRALGLPLILMALVWRAVGGPLFGLSLYLLFRRLLAGTTLPWAWASGASMVCLCDAGFTLGAPFLRDIGFLRNAWLGKYWLLDYSRILQHRVVTPLLNLPVLLALLAVLASPTRSRKPVIAAAGILLALCVYLYFYTWTTAVAGLGLYALVQLCAGRKTEASIIACVLALGLALGAPQIIANSRTFSAPVFKPILERSVTGLHLAAGNPMRRLHLVNVWFWADLAAGGAAIRFFRPEGLGPVACVGLASYLLANHAIVTGLEFQNDHFLSTVGFPLGEIMALTALAFLLDRSLERKAKALLCAVPALLCLFALWWMPYQALAAPWSARWSATMAELRPLAPSLAALGPGCTLAGPAEVSVAVLYSRCIPLFQRPDLTTSMITLAQVHERHALNGWLRGLDLPGYLAMEGTDVEKDLDWYLRPEGLPRDYRPEVVRAARGELFKRLLSGNAPELLDRYRPNALLLPASAPAPTRAGPWELVRKTDAWSLWKKS